MDTYEDERNALSPDAETYADNQVGKRGTKPDRWNPIWARHYFREMDRLATEAGLQSERFHK